MDLKIRNVDQKMLRQIDHQIELIHEKTGKKMSRNAYLVMLMDKESSRDLDQYKRDKFDVTIQAVNDLFLENLKALNRIYWMMSQGDSDKAISTLESWIEDMNKFEEEEGNLNE